MRSKNLYLRKLCKRGFTSFSLRCSSEDSSRWSGRNYVWRSILQITKVHLSFKQYCLLNWWSGWNMYNNFIQNCVIEFSTVLFYKPLENKVTAIELFNKMIFNINLTSRKTMLEIHRSCSMNVIKINYTYRSEQWKVFMTIVAFSLRLLQNNRQVRYGHY